MKTIDIFKEEINALCKLEELKHKNRLDEILKEAMAKREIEMLKFNHEIELQRIKSAEIRKTQMRKIYPH
jgi:hypothetical protein